MSADLLRRAAAKLRKHADEAVDQLTLGVPWEAYDDEQSDTTEVHANLRNLTSVIAQEVLSPQHGAYIALMHPPVALALAELLEILATEQRASNPFDLMSAESLARAILREPS